MLVNKLENNNQTKLSENEIIDYIEKFSSIINEIKLASNPKIILEINLIKLMDTSMSNNVQEVSEMPEIKKKVKIETYEKEEKKVEKNTISDENIDLLEQLKLIRVENTLSNFDKKNMIKIKEKLENINSFIIDPDYSSIAGLIMDGVLKATSDKNMIFVYESDNISIDFNTKLPQIEELLNKIDVNMSVISVNIDEWNLIKQEFNSKTKKYQYNSDIDLFNKIFIDNKIKEKNSIEIMFDDIIKYD